jgi:hypothetical protein
MNIDNLTLAQCKKIAAIFGAQTTTQSSDGLVSKHVGKFVIVRTYASGVFFAKLEKHAGRMAELSYSRRLWSFKAAEGISLSAIAMYGVDPKKSKFPAAIPEQTVLDCLEFIPVSDVCRTSIESTPVAVQS